MKIEELAEGLEKDIAWFKMAHMATMFVLVVVAFKAFM
jgi:hypothetical protein